MLEGYAAGKWELEKPPKNASGPGGVRYVPRDSSHEVPGKPYTSATLATFTGLSDYPISFAVALRTAGLGIRRCVCVPRGHKIVLMKAASLSPSTPALSLDQCAAATGLAWPTLRNAVRNGRLSAVRIGNLIRVSPESLEKFQADRIVDVVPSVKR